MFDAVKPVSRAEIEAARARLEGLALVSPLVACDGRARRQERVPQA